MNFLKRFIDAQDNIYRVAYAEIKRGKKKSHWIWFIFPQLIGLGKSSLSNKYGLYPEEVIPYLQHPILSLRLRNILLVLLEHKNKRIEDIMGSNLDALKLQASMTLFDWYSPNDIFKQVLDAFYDGYKHTTTIDILNYVQKRKERTCMG